MAGIGQHGETEQSLVAALQQGRQEVLGLLYDAYAPVMMGVICRIVPDREVAEEVLQETFLAIWSRIGVYDASRNRFLTWGLAIARGIALEAQRSGKYKLAPPADGKRLEPLSKLSCHLSPDEKAILDLIYLKGRSCAEAAAELGIDEETLRQTLKRAFSHIKAGKSA